jgi:4-hydroxy-tetrahydrodipicolinate synthase
LHEYPTLIPKLSPFFTCMLSTISIRSSRSCWWVRLNSVRALSSIKTTANRKNIFSGIYPILVTPFLDDASESIDLDSFQRSISFMNNTGATGVTVAGVLGESNRITDLERQLLIQAAVDQIGRDDGRLKLCVGTTHTGTSATVALSQMAAELGADGVMIAPTKDPHGQQPSDDDILELFSRVSDACPSVSIILQDLPSQTGVFMSIDLLTRIATTVPNVQSIKLESPPTVQRLAALNASSEFCSSECTILTGLGALYAGFDVEQGISGFMTGFAFPEILIAIHSFAQAGEYEKVRALYAKYLPLIVLEQQPGGLAMRKEIYRKRGMIESESLRHPGKPISPALRKLVGSEISRSFPGIDITKPIPREVLLL